MARVDVIMPQMGESIAEGTISRWMKKVGDTVKRDEPIFEISTDKVDAEIPSPTAGTLAEILVQEGQTVAVQTVVAKIETDVGVSVAAGGGVATAPPGAIAPASGSVGGPSAGGAGANVPSGAAATPPPARASAPAGASAGTAPVRPVVQPAVPQGNGAETAEERLRRRSTPLVRKIAAEHNVDITTVPGTGYAGRVTKNDLETYLAAGAVVAPEGAAVPAQAPRRPAAQPDAGTVAPGGAVTAPGGPAAEPWPGDQVNPWSRIRRLTAEHMVMSRRVSPHVNTVFEIDYTRVAQIRAAKKREYADRGVNLTYLAFIAKAVTDSLRKHPGLNAAVAHDATILRRDINLGIAVALDWGLIVPVIHGADSLSLFGISRAINDLGERARTKKLSPDEVQKGTFTITNPGVFGSMIGTPIINQPQAAILCVGSIEKRPAVVTVDGVDALAVRLQGMLSLAFDHRVVDGADADRFMADVKATLEQFPETAA